MSFHREHFQRKKIEKKVTKIKSNLIIHTYLDELTIFHVNSCRMNTRAQEIKGNLLPEKSGWRYRNAEAEFRGWVAKQEGAKIDEDTVLVYLSEKAEKSSPNPLFALFSMIKTTCKEVNMESYHQVKAYLKKINKGYQPKKS